LVLEGSVSKVVSYDFDEKNVFFGLIMSGASTFIPGISAGAFDTTLGPNSQQNIESVIGRLDEDGQLLWSTYIGGSNFDILYNISVSDGVVAAGGTTNSNDFPLFQENVSTISSTYEYFLSKFDYDGNIIYSSYLGKPGANLDLSNRVITSDGYTAIVSTINSSVNYPVSQSPAPGLIDENRIAINVIAPNNDDYYSTLYNNKYVDFINVEFSDNQLCVLTSQEGNSGYVSIGAHRTSNASNPNSGHVYCIDIAAADVSFATYVGQDNFEQRGFIEIENANVYYAGLQYGESSAIAKRELFLQKFNATGNLQYEKLYIF